MRKASNYAQLVKLTSSIQLKLCTNQCSNVVVVVFFFLFTLRDRLCASYILKIGLAKRANCSSYIQSPEGPAISATSLFWEESNAV